MLKAPTKKSRMIARAGAALIAIGLILDAWFSPPLPRLSIPILSFVVVTMMQWAKKVRESDGVEVPIAVVKRGSYIANIEVSFALADGLCVAGVLGAEITGASNLYRQIATVGTLALFVISFLVFRLTRARFEALMKAADADLAAT
jgi:hypothetical protein